MAQQQQRQQRALPRRQQQRQPIPGLTVNVKKVTVKTESDPMTMLPKKPTTTQQQVLNKPKQTQVSQRTQRTQQRQRQRQQQSSPQTKQTTTLQTRQIYQQNTKNRPVDLQNIKLSRWSFSTSSDPQFYLDGQKVMIIAEKALPRDHNKLQYRVPENYSDKAIVVRRQKGGKEILEIYYLNIYDPNGKRVFLRTDMIMPTP
jgi:hypothetical protein